MTNKFGIYTAQEALSALIQNDHRNVVDVRKYFMPDNACRVVADCAKRLMAARELGDKDLLQDAEDNLELAVELLEEFGL